jgi:hypothetical protein
MYIETKTDAIEKRRSGIISSAQVPENHRTLLGIFDVPFAIPRFLALLGVRESAPEGGRWRFHRDQRGRGRSVGERGS